MIKSNMEKNLNSINLTNKRIVFCVDLNISGVDFFPLILTILISLT